MHASPSDTSSPPAALPAQPPNLPDPRDHPAIQVTGLHAWFLQLYADQTRAFLRYLFAWNLDDGSLDPSEYVKPLPTDKLIGCYDMSSTADQRSFIRLVHWAGHETPPSLPGGDSVAPGKKFNDCYLVTVVPSSRDAMRRSLGDNPWASSVASYLLNRTGEWNSERIRLTVGHVGATFSSTAYVQGHLETHKDGMKVKDLIPHLSGFLRVGAAAGDKLTLSAPATMAIAEQVPTVFDAKPAGSSMSLSLSVYFKVPASEGIGWTPFKTAAYVLMLGLYESVRLTSATFQINVPSGQQNLGTAAIVSAGKMIKGDDWYTAPIFKMFPGSDNGAVMGSFELPAVHSWNPELRAATRGNPPPEFKFGLTAPAGKTMVVTGQFTVLVSGQAVIGAASGVGTSKIAAEVRSIQKSIDYPTTQGGDRATDYDEDSEDDTAGPSRSSPPRQAAPPARPPTQSASRSG